eukprot:gnl/MRDRNA2_/MRDRNA2_124085_c0_seq1.p1 gnl/MRDRNA2_/MRDRNA2_124085_c0~~gnl/MRDRNA2_/MRDRNA2_124085_c0_seq1.p1  ORF type:complete len:371 (+),score=47.22 gnl/MRDRNA2_/MRDRNA2_124085_c0_seq1:68-1114(+)
MELHEMLIPTRQEKTAKLTHICLVVSRILFLFFHGLLVLSVSMSLSSSDLTSWWLAFTPVWIGDAVCGILVIASWFASCPYIHLCIEERQPRLGNSNPSILTEVLPDIAMGVLAFLFILLAFCGEYALCRYLDNQSRGEPASSFAAAMLLGTVSVLALCHSVCIKHNTALFGLLGGGFLTTLLMVVATTHSSESTRFLLVLPTILAVLGFVIVAAYRFREGRRVFIREERILRGAEWCALLTLLVVFLSMAKKVGGPNPLNAACEGIIAGSIICLIAALRARMYAIEMKHGIIGERLVRLLTACDNFRRSPSEVAMTPTPCSPQQINIDLGEEEFCGRSARRLNFMSA